MIPYKGSDVLEWVAYGLAVCAFISVGVGFTHLYYSPKIKQAQSEIADAHAKLAVMQTTSDVCYAALSTQKTAMDALRRDSDDRVARAEKLLAEARQQSTRHYKQAAAISVASRPENANDPDVIRARIVEQLRADREVKP